MRQDVKEQIKRYYDQEAALRDGKSARAGWKAEFRQVFLDRALQEGKKTPSTLFCCESGGIRPRLALSRSEGRERRGPWRQTGAPSGWWKVGGCLKFFLFW